MAVSSIDLSYRSYAAGVVSTSTVWGIVWCMYYLRSNAKQGGNKDAQSNNRKGPCCLKCSGSLVQKALRDDFNEEECDNDNDNDSSARGEAYDPWQSPPIWKMMWDSVRSTAPGGEGWQREKSTRNIGQSSKKRMRWPWESIRKKDKNNKMKSVDGDSGMANGDADSDLRTNGIGSNEVPKASSQYPDGCKEGKTTDYFGNNEGQQGESCNGLNTDHGSDHISLEEKSGLCIGSIFGLDVGGTLSKLVYFQRASQHEDHQIDNNDDIPFMTHHQSNPDLLDIGEDAEHYEDHYAHRSSFHTCMKDILDRTKVVSPRSNLKRVRSMFDMAKSKFEQRAQALDRFYTLVSRLEDRDSGVKENNLSFHSPTLGGEFHFIRFETRYMTQAMKLIRAHSLHLNIVQMGATGGGAHKYANSFEENLGIQMAKKGELDSLVVGMQFVLSDVDGECYTFEPNEDFSRKHKPTPTPVAMPFEVTKAHITPKQHTDSSCREYTDVSSKKKINETKESENLKGGCSDENLWARKVKREFWTRKVKRDVVAKSESYPYMIVIIGTGVSILRVDGLGKHERISGSTIGGGTYWGLCRLLTDVEDYESVLNLAERGKSSKVDMMVGDIYGKKVDVLEKYGLTADVVASSFGKLGTKAEPAAGLKQEDLARALLLMVTNNIGQVAYLNAQIHNTKRIYFVGNFLRHNVISQQRLAYAINYWSRGKMEALFLEHEGYLGALGAYLLHQGPPSDKVKASKSSASKIRGRQRKDAGKKTRSMSA